jgi:hypothetical protein
MKSVIYRYVILGSLIAAALSPNAKTQPQKSSQELSKAEIRQREAAVFDALDLTRPDLAAVAAAWKQHEAPAAEKALAAYLRARESVHWGPDTETGNRGLRVEHDKTLAEWAVAGKLQGGQTPYFYTFPNGDIDWHYNATQHMPGVAPDNEWQWQLNRMPSWGPLGRWYRETHDERYAQTFDREMLSWIAQCPVADHVDNVPGSAWRTIEAGIRMGGSWPAAFFAFRRSPSLSDADLVLFVSAFLDHGNYLRHYNTRLNFLTMEMSGLYAVGALFPEFKNAAEWRSFAAGKLTEEARTQFLPDGAQDELSTEYQNVALGNILKILEIARWTGRLAELPAGYAAPLEKGYEFQVAIMAPDRFSPKYNNGLPQYLPSIFKLAVENFPDRSVFKWVASNGVQGKPPAFTSAFLNRAGEAAMRSGWSREDNYLGFRLGPIGMGHQHQDKLGVVIWAWGRSLVFNTGGGSYEQSKWRTWATSSFGSNCMIVDDLGQNRPTTSKDPWHDPDLISQGPIDGHWQTNSVFDFASGDYSEGYGPQRLKAASQRRDVLFLKPDLFVVADRMRPNDAKRHKYQARWQLLTTNTHIAPETNVLSTTDADLANIAIVPLLRKRLAVTAVSGQESPEILGWNVRKDMDPQNVPATTLLHTRTGAGPQLLLTLFIPLHPGQANPVTSVKQGKDGHSATVTFTDGRKLLISAPGERGINVEEKLPRGKAGRSAIGGKD